MRIYKETDNRYNYAYLKADFGQSIRDIIDPHIHYTQIASTQNLRFAQKLKAMSCLTVTDPFSF